jgi:hypothetical protein
MDSTINSSCSQSLFWPRHCRISGILTTGDGTLAISSGTLMVDCRTLTADVGMLAVSSGTLTVDESILTVSDGTLMSNGQHRLNSAITNVTR